MGFSARAASPPNTEPHLQAPLPVLKIQNHKPKSKTLGLPPVGFLRPVLPSASHLLSGSGFSCGRRPWSKAHLSAVGVGRKLGLGAVSLQWAWAGSWDYELCLRFNNQHAWRPTQTKAGSGKQTYHWAEWLSWWQKWLLHEGNLSSS